MSNAISPPGSLPPFALCVKYSIFTFAKLSVRRSIWRSSSVWLPVSTELTRISVIDDLEVVERLLAGLAHREHAFGDVLAVRAGQPQVRRGLVDVLHDRDVIEVRLAGATAAAVMERAGVGHSPVETAQIDRLLRLEGDIHGFAGESIELEEHIDSHGGTPVRLRPQAWR